MRQGPWYTWAHRWCQTNLTEEDGAGVDIAAWRAFWRENAIQGVIVNAGGIVAYYPSAFPEQYRARTLGERDVLGDFVAAAREEGLAVLARMDCNRAGAALLREHPEWFARNRAGDPYAAGDRFLTCVNSGYYREYIPALLREIAARYAPDGFTDNSWQGPNARQICYCENCRTRFAADTGLSLPEAPDWDDPTYRAWIRWSFGLRRETYERFNRVARTARGEDCLWLGMVNANPVDAHCALYDLKEIAALSPVLMTDHQGRDALNGFEQNSYNGLLLHALAGWNALIPESAATYVRGVQAFRRAANPPLETQKWMQEGLAGGISPWTHFIGGRQEDRRVFATPKKLLREHAKLEPYLYDRAPLCNVGLIWSQENINFYGRDARVSRCAEPWRGFTRALTRARIPALPVHADHIGKYASDLDLLILPDLAAMSDAQIEAVAAFLQKGGSVLATGRSGMLGPYGDERQSSPLDAPLGIRRRPGLVESQASSDWENYARHSYLRLQNASHPLFAGFADTAILPFGGTYVETEAQGLVPLATFVPPFPIYPPELSCMGERDSGLPLVFAGESGFGGRVVYFAADIDRCFCRYDLPDHGELLANAVRFALCGRDLLRVSGPGRIDCRLYEQTAQGRLVLHIVNLSGAENNPGYLEEEYPVGPLRVQVRAGDRPLTRAVLPLIGETLPLERQGEWVTFALPRLESWALIVLE